MPSSRVTRIGLRVATIATVGFIYIPIGVVILYGLNAGRLATWPIEGLTFDWFGRAFADDGIRRALLASLQAAIGATAVALVLGTLLSLAVHRFTFFGRDTLSLLVILPIALPGIVTGIALNTAFRALGVDLGLLTVIVGHATFCIVVIYNNAIARLRRSSRSIEEASLDLGATPFQTFRYVTFPVLRTALLAGALLAFALSFDEIIVTTFTAGAGTQTLPIWIFSNYQRPNQLPLVNVAAAIVLVLSIAPVYVASRLTSDPTAVAARR